MKNFIVYFEMVNGTQYEVRAKTEEAAIKAAMKKWHKDNLPCVETGGCYEFKPERKKK